jgi:hypothetical protein
MPDEQLALRIITFSSQPLRPSFDRGEPARRLRFRNSPADPNA